MLTCVLGPEHILKNKAECEAVVGSCFVLFFCKLPVFSLYFPLSLTLVTLWGGLWQSFLLLLLTAQARRGEEYLRRGELPAFPTARPPAPGQTRLKGIPRGGVDWRRGAQAEPQGRESFKRLLEH